MHKYFSRYYVDRKIVFEVSKFPVLCPCFLGLTSLGTIPTLRQHILGLFLAPPPPQPTYVSINSTERQQKLAFF